VLNENNIVIVEWGGIVEDILPAGRISIKFQPSAGIPDERIVTINYPLSMQTEIAYIETEWKEGRP
jgi:tRNA A37 threonylcarbamoyladenosine biosynthesis protein TsaE